MKMKTKKSNVKKNISEKIVHYLLTMDDDEMAGISAAKLASKFRHAGTNPSRLFHEIHGRSLSTFIRQFKILKGALLLVENRHLTVREVSEKCGYNREDYFIKCFKEFFIVTPGQYRELTGQAREN